MSQLSSPMVEMVSEAALVRDVEFLARFLESLGVSVGLSKFLSGFLPEIAKDLVSGSGNANRPTVTFLGGRGVGKSTLVNWMAGRPLAPTGWSPHGRPYTLVTFLGEPGASDAAATDLRPEFAQFGSVTHRVKYGGLAVPVVIQDYPKDITERGTIIGRSDGVIFVASAERYADVIPLEYARWCALAGCGIAPILNMVDEMIAVSVRDDWRRILDSRLPEPVINPIAIPRISREQLSTKGLEIATIVWQSVCRMLQQSVREKKRMKQRCLLAFLELMDKSGLSLYRGLLDDASIRIRSEGILVGREFMAAARARLSSTGLSAAGQKLLDLLEVPGPGRIWSLGFRLAGWPLRLWLLGRTEESSHEISETTIRRILGNWIAKVRLSVFDMAMKKGVIQNELFAAVRWKLKSASRIDLAPLIAKAAELDAVLKTESNETAREWLSARPGTLGLLRAIIAVAQGFCLGAAIWYGSAGFLSLVYLIVFAGFADMVLVLGVRLPLLFIERQALGQWEKRIGAEVIDPCAKLLEGQLADQAGPAAEAVAAADRVKRTLAVLLPDLEKGL